ncbi:DNA-binding transcriptional regulator, MarR family [Pseudonocardia thermophila]|uniref:DNA-binding transcriptional regulator, MarR family n=1 Tax=Pseudonocardia thermophila TaxID=1848 RepID=A0A1M7ANS5_PSETH|nr:MarR family transcriptional regulator [Pseudonocardia thermophila]SHL44390.1 DNA-binding transcriptional regulator, MarR family [Pseudonocardia thermophila]
MTPAPRDVGEAVLNAAAKLNRLLETACAEEGISPLEARLMRTLRDEVVSQGELAERLALDPARISTLTGGLEKRGLLERVPSRSDRRQRHARLTPEGVEVVKRIGARLVGGSPLDRLTEDERAALVRLLDRAVEGL